MRMRAPAAVAAANAAGPSALATAAVRSSVVDYMPGQIVAPITWRA
jgi:hypothetical protein